METEMSTRVVPTGRIEAERVQCTQVKVENVGKDAEVRDEIHAWSNYFIKESRPYFSNEKLPTYIYCPYFLGMAGVLCVSSLFGLMSFWGLSEYIAVFFFIACVLIFFIFCQHEWVNQKSLPVVFKQPVFDSQRTRNAFYEVTVTELDGVAFQNYQAGVGFIQMSQGKIKFQAFNKTSIKQMSDARWHSRLMLVVLAIAFAINCFFMVVSSSK